MIDGLKLTIPGGELRTLLEAQIQHHEQSAARWTREQERTSADETDDAPLLPDHLCEREADRHEWRAKVLAFIRDRIEAVETYRLAAADLEFGGLLPRAPGSVAQEDYEQRNRIGFALERATKALEGVSSLTYRLLASRDVSDADGAPTPPSQNDETDSFRTTRVDVEGGPEVIVIERK